MAGNQYRTRDGRYSHIESHAGFDRQNFEWAICDHCLKYKRHDSNRWVAKSDEWATANLLPNRLWPTEADPQTAISRSR